MKGNAVNAEANAVELTGSACMQMADGAAELQEAVVRLCCLWWQKELPGKADMVPQMIPYLLYQATVSGTLSGNCCCLQQCPLTAALLYVVRLQISVRLNLNPEGTY